jgi:hypothetical protein
MPTPVVIVAVSFSTARPLETACSEWMLLDFLAKYAAPGMQRLTFGAQALQRIFRMSRSQPVRSR